MANRNIVRINEGLVHGELIHNEFGGNYYSFKGIPYAEPPIGDLRFKAPQPAQPWSGIRNASEFGSECYQYDLFKKVPAVSGNEDCLYLNVYTPKITLSTLLPVMVWIYGGGFVWGSGDDSVYGPEFLVRQDIILVTFNYRLGPLGFLSLGTADVPGNAGMKDQVAALRWVKKNIRNFGGDSEKITIFGQSAGAGSVSLHLLSPMTKGLFKRAIVQSGSVPGYWVQAFEPKAKAEKLARQLGLPDTTDDKKLYDFYKTQLTEAFINNIVPITYAEKEQGKFNIDFIPTIEKDFGQERFLDDYNYKMLQKGIHQGVDVMMGYVEDEGILFLKSLEVLDTDINAINNFSEALVPIQLTRELLMKQQLEVGSKMKNFYFNDEPATREDWRKFMRYVRLHTILYDMMQFQKRIANSTKSFFYKFTTKSKRNFFKKVFTADDVTKGIDVVCHCDDLSYLFPVNFMGEKVEKDSKEFQLIDRMTKLWTNFAKYGNPTPDKSIGVKWKPYTLKHQHYLNIGEKLVLEKRPEVKDIEFWEKIYRQYAPWLMVH